MSKLKPSPDTNAIAMLKKDHLAVKQLFDQFEDTESFTEKQEIMDKAIHELKIHATLEEEIFYPAIRGQVEDDLMNEAEQEHHVARVLIAELDMPTGDEGRRIAKFTVLAEGVRHHIKEEEGQVLPAAKDLDIDFDELGSRMLDRKQELMDAGVPADAEHEMVSGASEGKAQPPRERTSVGAGKSRAKKTSSRESSKEKRNAG